MIDKMIIDGLRDELKEIKLRISNLRKKGEDLTIAHLMTINIPSKIGMLEVTLDDSDLQKIKLLLQAVDAEVKEVERKVTTNEK